MIARKVENVRGADLDYVQYAVPCLHPVAFCESKSYLVHDKEWLYTRNHAVFYGCLALLVIEGADVFGVKYFEGKTGEMHGPRYGGEEILIMILELARDRHECPLL